MVVRQYSSKGNGLQKRPPPKPKVNVDNLILYDNSAAVGGGGTKNKKKGSHEEMASNPKNNSLSLKKNTFHIPKCEPPSNVLQFREPESSRRHGRSTGREQRRGGSSNEQRDGPPQSTRTSRRDPSPPPVRRVKAPARSPPRSRSQPRARTQPRSPKAMTHTATTKIYRTKSLDKRHHKVPKSPSSNFLKAQARAPPSPQPRQRPVTNPQPKTTKTVRIQLPEDTKRGVDDKVVEYLDRCFGDFDLYDFLDSSGERYEIFRHYIQSADERTMPGKVRLLYQKSRCQILDTYQRSGGQVGSRIQKSMKAMGDADQGKRPEPELEPKAESETKSEDDQADTDDELCEGNEKKSDMNFKVESTADKDKLLAVLLDKQPVANVEQTEVMPTKDSSTSEQVTGGMDFSPLKKEVKQVQKRLSVRLGHFLADVAKELVGDASLCGTTDETDCTHVDEAMRCESEVPKPTIQAAEDNTAQQAPVKTTASDVSTTASARLHTQVQAIQRRRHQSVSIEAAEDKGSQDIAVKNTASDSPTASVRLQSNRRLHHQSLVESGNVAPANKYAAACEKRDSLNNNIPSNDSEPFDNISLSNASSNEGEPKCDNKQQDEAGVEVATPASRRNSFSALITQKYEQQEQESFGETSAEEIEDNYTKQNHAAVEVTPSSSPNSFSGLITRRGGQAQKTVVRTAAEEIKDKYTYPPFYTTVQVNPGEWATFEEGTTSPKTESGNKSSTMLSSEKKADAGKVRALIQSMEYKSSTVVATKLLENMEEETRGDRGIDEESEQKSTFLLGCPNIASS